MITDIHEPLYLRVFFWLLDHDMALLIGSMFVWGSVAWLKEKYATYTKGHSNSDGHDDDDYQHSLGCTDSDLGRL